MNKTENEKSQLEVQILDMNSKLADLDSKYNQILQEKGTLFILLPSNSKQMNLKAHQKQ